MAELDVYQLIFDLATAEQIRDLLRRHRRESSREVQKEIHLTGNKPDLVDDLRRAVAANHIPFPDVLDLLQEAEENGDQHVFYFAPRNRAARDRYRDGVAIAE